MEVPFTWEHQDLIQWFQRNNKPPEHGGCECRVASQLSCICYLNVKNHPDKKGVKFQKKLDLSGAWKNESNLKKQCARKAFDTC